MPVTRWPAGGDGPEHQVPARQVLGFLGPLHPAHRDLTEGGAGDSRVCRRGLHRTIPALHHGFGTTIPDCVPPRLFGPPGRVALFRASVPGRWTTTLRPQGRAEESEPALWVELSALRFVVARGPLRHNGTAKADSCSIFEAFALVERLAGQAQIFDYVEDNRVGDRICYYSDLRKMRAQYPGWDPTLTLEHTLARTVDARQTKLVS